VLLAEFCQACATGYRRAVVGSARPDRRVQPRHDPRQCHGLGLDQAAVNAAIGKVEAKPGSLRGPNAGIGISQAGPDAAMAESVAKLAAVTRRTAG